MNKERRTALIVDDDPDIREAEKLILESNGYEVFTARNGNIGCRR